MISLLPHVNALINTGVAILLVVGLVLIKKGHHETHKKVMIAALGLSALFFASYLTYHYNHGSTKFTGIGPVRTVYFTVLLTHTVLAVINLPFIIVTVRRAWRGEFAKHRRIARVTWYMWFYVAVTGPLVYLMLYQLYPASKLTAAYDAARALHKAGREEAALAEYRRLAVVHPGAACFAAVLGDRLEGTKTAAEKLASEEDPTCVILRGRELIYANKLEEAKPVLTSVVAAAPNDDFAHASLGFLQFRLYEYREAAASFERAAELDPTVAMHVANAGYAHYHYGNYPKARPFFTKAIALGLTGEFRERIVEAKAVIDGAKWICPMHAHVTGKEGDTCGECKMALEPAKVDVTVEENP